MTIALILLAWSLVAATVAATWAFGPAGLGAIAAVCALLALLVDFDPVTPTERED